MLGAVCERDIRVVTSSPRTIFFLHALSLLISVLTVILIMNTTNVNDHDTLHHYTFDSYKHRIHWYIFYNNTPQLLYLLPPPFFFIFFFFFFFLIFDTLLFARGLLLKLLNVNVGHCHSNLHFYSGRCKLPQYV